MNESIELGFGKKLARWWTEHGMRDFTVNTGYVTGDVLVDEEGEGGEFNVRMREEGKLVRSCQVFVGPEEEERTVAGKFTPEQMGSLWDRGQNWMLTKETIDEFFDEDDFSAN